MHKSSQGKENIKSQKKQVSRRLSIYRGIFVGMAYRAGLTMEEIADIFGTTKQNVSLIVKANKKYENNQP